MTVPTIKKEAISVVGMIIAAFVITNITKNDKGDK
jgi:hypothetical protein